MIKYDVYKRPSGLFYRVPLNGPLHSKSEVFAVPSKKWVKSGLKVGDIVSSPWSYLHARNVIFKDSLCSQ